MDYYFLRAPKTKSSLSVIGDTNKFINLIKYVAEINELESCQFTMRVE
jgi:hypothetical protein